MKSVCTGRGYYELSHLPDIYVSFFIILGIPTPVAIIHHFHFPARREALRDDFCGPFQVQSLPVTNSKEQDVRVDAADDETCTARMEVPLQYEVCVNVKVTV